METQTVSVFLHIPFPPFPFYFVNFARSCRFVAQLSSVSRLHFKLKNPNGISKQENSVQFFLMEWKNWKKYYSVFLYIYLW